MQIFNTTDILVFHLYYYWKIVFFIHPLFFHLFLFKFLFTKIIRKRCPHTKRAATWSTLCKPKPKLSYLILVPSVNHIKSTIWKKVIANSVLTQIWKMCIENKLYKFNNAMMNIEIQARNQISILLDFTSRYYYQSWL